MTQAERSISTRDAQHNPRGWTADGGTFGARLALIRQRMSWNIKEAATECGVPAATWRWWEIDGGLPRNQVETCKQIAARTGCDPLWLAGIDGEPTQAVA